MKPKVTTFCYERARWIIDWSAQLLRVGFDARDLLTAPGHPCLSSRSSFAPLAPAPLLPHFALMSSSHSTLSEHSFLLLDLASLAHVNHQSLSRVPRSPRTAAPKSSAFATLYNLLLPFLILTSSLYLPRTPCSHPLNSCLPSTTFGRDFRPRASATRRFCSSLLLNYVYANISRDISECLCKQHTRLIIYTFPCVCSRVAKIRCWLLVCWISDFDTQTSSLSDYKFPSHEMVGAGYQHHFPRLSSPPFCVDPESFMPNSKHLVVPPFLYSSSPEWNLYGETSWIVDWLSLAAGWNSAPSMSLQTLCNCNDVI